MRWMINCKQYTELVSQRMDRPLSISSRLAIRLHGWLCPPCERVARQFSMLREACRVVPPENEDHSKDVLPEHTCQRIKAALKECTKSEGCTKSEAE